MARTQSKKRRLFGFAKTSNLTSGLASPPGRSDTRVGDLTSIPETCRASPGRLARMRRFFHRSNRGSPTAIATEATDTQAGGVHQVAPDHDATARSTGAQEQQKPPLPAPTEHAEKSVTKQEPEPKLALEPEPKLESKPKPEGEPTPASAGQHVDAAVKEFGGVDPISGITKDVVDGVGIVNTTYSDIQTLRWES
ncbi:hypothetical protein EDD15DRAFT_141510 [Pisolithus albus]|nr:hypothetical protein EDD15DRAFT_141510 [Pisolithus albus]